MEKRLIDANEVKENILGALDVMREISGKNTLVDAISNAICACIDGAKTEDSVKQGKWYIAEAYNGYLYWNCDQCHKYFTSQKSNYCHNCGARMDEV